MNSKPYDGEIRRKEVSRGIVMKHQINNRDVCLGVVSIVALAVSSAAVAPLANGNVDSTC